MATVHAGMGYRHAILAIEADGQAVYDLKIPGCRPDISPDGKRIAWGPSDWALRVGDLDFSGERRSVVNARDVVTSEKPMKIYHVDWSPDGKYIAFSRGPDQEDPGHDPRSGGRESQGLEHRRGRCHADQSLDDDHLRRQLQQGTRLDPARGKRSP